MSLRRRLLELAKRMFFWIYKAGTRLGVHLLPVHFYTPEPDIVELERTRAVWARPSEMPGVRVDLDEQVENLMRICLPYQSEYQGNRPYREGVAAERRLRYGYVEAQALYAVVRQCRPSQVVEVGGGLSSRVTCTALNANAAQDQVSGRLTCVEPYPSRALRALAATEARLTLIAQPVQRVPTALFTSLSRGDILFVDSSHVVKAGSDVTHLLLEVLPRLNPGVLVHFHDIFLPYDYQPDVLDSFLHLNETPFLHAFLAFNDRFRILFCLSHLHHARPQALTQVFPEYEPLQTPDGLRSGFRDARQHLPTSLWLEVNG